MKQICPRSRIFSRVPLARGMNLVWEFFYIRETSQTKDNTAALSSLLNAFNWKPESKSSWSMNFRKASYEK